MSGDRFDYSSERQRHEKFVGRAGLLARLDQLLVDSEMDCWVVITGGPGMGKSALLAAWLARHVAAGAVVPHHFIRRGAYDWDDPAKLVGSLVAQIEDAFPELHELETDERMHPATRLARALSRVSENQLRPRGERMVVLIDGLDEYDPPVGSSAGDPLAAFLPSALPAGVRLLCASRPRHPYVSSLEARDGELVQIDLDDPGNAADNDATVRMFWEGAAGPLGLDAGFVDETVARAGGNVQHAVQLRKHLAVLPPEQRRVEDIPRGLAALIEKSWERIAVDPVVVDGLGILCAAREALTLDELSVVAGWTGEAQRRTFVRAAKELLVETLRPSGPPEYQLHHDSIRGHIARTIGEVALRAHHRALAQRLATWPAPEYGVVWRYALRHALIHRVEASEWADAWQLAADMSFLEARCRELGAHETEADVARVAERCRASDDAVVSRRFDDLARALGRESHWLRAEPEATAALVWNRLRRSGWDANDLDGQLRVPADSFLRVRHAITRESPAVVRDLVGHSGIVTACAVTADGRRVISASYDRTLKVWDLESGRALATLEGHTGAVTACAVTADGQRVVSASFDGTLKVWDLESGHALAVMEGHTGWVMACTVTADGRCVVSASRDGTLKVWDLESGCALATLEGHAGGVMACAVTADGRGVVSASVDRTLKIWDLESGFALATLEHHTDMVTACAVTANGRRMVSASNDRTLEVWDLESGSPLATLEGHTDWVRACAVTVDGRRVVSASYDQTLKVWDLESGRALATLEGHTDGVACAVTADGRRVVSVSWDKTLKVWDLERGRVLATLEGHTGRVTACAVTADGRCLISASLDRTLKVWDLERGRALATLEGHTGGVAGCAVTADGRRVISASADGRLKVWDLERGHTLATLEGHTATVTGCAVMADGRRVISASEDRTLKVWDLETYACLLTHRGDAPYLAVATSATAIVAGDAAGALWFLDWPSSTRRAKPHRSSGSDDRQRRSQPAHASPSPKLQTKKHIILLLAANPLGTDPLALDREARAIHVELKRSGYRDCFELVTRWAAEPLDLLRELRELKPTVVHFSGHGGQNAASADRQAARRRDVVSEPSVHKNDQGQGLFFQGPNGRAQFVSAAALTQTFGAAGASVKLVVLNACYSEVQATALVTHVDCVVGMGGSIQDNAARNFAIGFYGGLGARESVAAAYQHGRAAISLEGLSDSDRPQLKVRGGVDANHFVLAADPS